MREFNEYERKIIYAINLFSKQGIVQNFDSIIIATCLTNKEVFIDFSNKTADLHLDINYYHLGANLLVDEVLKFNYTILTTINVIKTLEENGLLISYFQTAPVKTGVHNYGNFIQGNNFITAQIHDPKTIDELINFYQKSIAGNEQLSNFVNRGYKTKGELIRDIEITVALVALISSTLIGVIELWHHSEEIHLLKHIYFIFRIVVFNH